MAAPWVLEVLLPPALVLWVLTPAFIANASATLPGGRGPPMDFGHGWSRDGRRILGTSKTWSGFVFGTLFGLPFGLVMAYLILIAPPSLALVPQFGPTVLASVPVILLLTGGAMSGDALGSFIKRRLGRESGARTLLLDQMPFVLVPVLVGLLLFPATFDPAFLSLEGVIWLLIFTLGFHAGFNWIGYKLGAKRVPW
jgi:CDP-2,3-bis-(O-geranylgeranyl)-sn-glycerol synthase